MERFVWVCDVAWRHELGQTSVKVFPTKEALISECDCVLADPDLCTPTRLRVTEEWSEGCPQFKEREDGE